MFLEVQFLCNWYFPGDVLMKELACMLIHVRKIFSCRMSFKMMSWMCLANCWEGTLNNFQNATFEKITIIVREVVLIQVSFLTTGSKQTKNNEHTEYHDISIPFKSQIHSKQGSHIFFCLDMDFTIISPCLDRAKVFTVNYYLTNLVNVQRLHENGFCTFLQKNVLLFSCCSTF